MLHQVPWTSVYTCSSKGLGPDLLPQWAGLHSTCPYHEIQGLQRFGGAITSENWEEKSCWVPQPSPFWSSPILRLSYWGNRSWPWGLTSQKQPVSWANPTASTACMGGDYSCFYSSDLTCGPQYKMNMDLLEQSQRRPERCSEGWSPSALEMGWERQGYSTERSKGSREIFLQPSSI